MKALSEHMNVSRMKQNPPTYAAVVSASDVKCAASEAIREQHEAKAIQTIQATIVVYGFPDWRGLWLSTAWHV